MGKGGSGVWWRGTGKGESELLPVFLFVARFLALSIPFHLLLELEVVMKPLQVLVAGQVAWLLNSFGALAVSQESWVYTPELSLHVIAACTGWRSAAAFLALVAALPEARGKEKALLWLPLLYLFNLFRLASVAAAGPEMAVWLHSFFWREGTLFAVLFTWLAWWRLSGRQ